MVKWDIPQPTKIYAIKRCENKEKYSIKAHVIYAEEKEKQIPSCKKNLPIPPGEWWPGRKLEGKRREKRGK